MNSLNLGHGPRCVGLVFFNTIGTFMHKMVRESIRDFDFVGDLIERIEEWKIGGFFIGLIVAIGFLQILSFVLIKFILRSLTDIVVNAGVALVLCGHSNNSMKKCKRKCSGVFIKIVESMYLSFNTKINMLYLIACFNVISISYNFIISKKSSQINLIVCRTC